MADKIIFVDNSTVELSKVIGVKQRIDENSHDILVIEFSNQDNIDEKMLELRKTFSDTNKTKDLKFFSEKSNKEYSIGTGYTNFISCRLETRKRMGELYTTILVLLSKPLQTGGDA